MSLELKSPDFTAGGNIPKQFTCEGADISPALSWDAPTTVRGEEQARRK